jgi:hypothetical protein
MTPTIAPEVVAEYQLRCSCGAFIFSTEKTVTCAYCGQILGIRRKKKHRQHWTTVPQGSAIKGWRWRKLVVESVADRIFLFRCACGAAIVTTEKTATCTDCGQAVGVRRAMRRGQADVVVKYGFDCCFCEAPIEATGKTVTCANCAKTLNIVRIGTQRQFWKAVPHLAGPFEHGDAGEVMNAVVLSVLSIFCLFWASFLALYLYDVINS